MRKSSAEEIRQKIIGLGENSVKKSYYPLLQEKIVALEEKQSQLMETVRSLEEREVELEQLVETKDALLMEVNHRVKNNLQMIISILGLGSTDSALDSEVSLFNKSRKRIETISMIYQDFLLSGKYQDVSFCSLLKTIAADIRAEHGMPGVVLDYDFPVNELIINIEAAIPLALIVYEVIDNSFQFAFSRNGGRLSVALIPVENSKIARSFNLRVSDNGPGFPDNSESSDEGLSGLLLIDALAAQIGGTYCYQDSGEGVSFKLNFEINEPS